MIIRENKRRTQLLKVFVVISLFSLIFLLTVVSNEDL